MVFYTETHIDSKTPWESKSHIWTSCTSWTLSCHPARIITIGALDVEEYELEQFIWNLSNQTRPRLTMWKAGRLEPYLLRKDWNLRVFTRAQAGNDDLHQDDYMVKLYALHLASPNSSIYSMYTNRRPFFRHKTWHLLIS